MALEFLGFDAGLVLLTDGGGRQLSVAAAGGSLGPLRSQCLRLTIDEGAAPWWLAVPRAVEDLRAETANAELAPLTADGLAALYTAPLCLKHCRPASSRPRVA